MSKIAKHYNVIVNHCFDEIMDRQSSSYTDITIFDLISSWKIFLILLDILYKENF